MPSLLFYVLRAILVTSANWRRCRAVAALQKKGIFNKLLGRFLLDLFHLVEWFDENVP